MLLPGSGRSHYKVNRRELFIGHGLQPANSLELQLPARFCPVICQYLDYDSRGSQFDLFVTCAHPLALHCPRGISRVEAGAQGMHKLQRGYMPSFTYSSHYIVDESLRGIVGRFLYAELQRTRQNLQVGLLPTPAPWGKALEKRPCALPVVLSLLD